MKGVICTFVEIILLQPLSLSAFSQDTIRDEQTIKNKDQDPVRQKI